MSQVTVTIAGKTYRMACDDGQEEHLYGLASRLDAILNEIRGVFGEIGDQRLTVMASLTIADELQDAERRIRGFEEEIEVLREGRVAASDRARATQSAIANALNAASDRIERMTQELNKPLAGNVALG